jgi:RND family efflux transporter MFP subunit
VMSDSRSFPLEAEVDNPDGAVKPGTFVRAVLHVPGTEKGVLVPEDAVVLFAGNPRVFVVADGHAAEHPVVTGPRQGGRVLLRSGVAAGDKVVTTGAALLVDGGAVTVR